MALIPWVISEEPLRTAGVINSTRRWLVEEQREFAVLHVPAVSVLSILVPP